MWVCFHLDNRPCHVPSYSFDVCHVHVRKCVYLGEKK
jgi:hypothetical protein